MMYHRTTTAITVIWTTLVRFTAFAQNTGVVLPIVMPYSRRYERDVTSALSTINRATYMRYMRKNRPTLQKVILKSDSPDEILQIFNETFMKGDTNCVVYIQYKDDPTAIAAADYTLNLLREIGLPVLLWDPQYDASLEKIKEPNILQLAPTSYNNAEAMLQLMQNFNWTHFVIVTSTRTNYFDFIESVKNLVQAKNRVKTIPPGPEYTILETILCDIGEGEDESDYRRLMESCLRTVPRYNRIFLLHTESKYAITFLESALKLNLLTKEHQWILSTSSVGVVASYLAESYPVGVIGLTYKADMRSESAAIRTAIINSVRVWIRMMNKIGSNTSLELFPDFTKSKKWKSGQIIYRELLNTDIIKDTSSRDKAMVEFTDNGLNKFTSLQIVNTQMKTLGSSTRPSWTKVGNWVPQVLGTRRNIRVEPKIELASITWPGNQPFPPLGRPARRFFNIATLLEEPYVMYLDRDAVSGKCIHPAVECRIGYNATEHFNDTTYENGTVAICCSGLSIDLLRILSERMRFDFNLFEVPDKKFGIQDKNGEWNGLIELLQDNKADMAITSLQITPRRSQAVEFSMPYLETGTTIVVSLTKGAVSPTAVLEPYDYPAWCLILVFSVHSIGASIFIFEWLSPAGLDQGKTPLREHKFSLFRSFWLIWAMLFGAAVSTDNPRGVSSRFLGNVWALFALVFLASYTANLAAFMITKESYYNISGIQDWRLTSPYKHKPKPFKFATVPDGSTEENLRETQPGMFKYMSQYNQVGVKDAIKALKAQEINAFIYDATPLEYQVGIDPDCSLRTVGQWYAMTGYGVGFPKITDPDLITEVDTIILDLQEDGELGRLRKFWLAGACHSKNNQKQRSDELDILNFSSAFILLAVGIVLGAVLLLLEHLYFRFGRKCLKQYDKCGCCALVSLSMGKSLTFEQTIMEAIDLHKKHRCKDPLCETQLWKAKHELDLALLKIQKLNRELGAIKTKRPLAIKAKPEYSADGDTKFVDDNSTSMSKPSETVNGPSNERRKDPALRRSPSYTSAIAAEDGAAKESQTNINSKNDTNTDTRDVKDSDASRNKDNYVFGDGEV